MTKKIITILVACFALFLFSNIAFAENAGEEIKDSWDKTTQSMQNAGATVGNTMKNAGDNIGDAMKNTGDKMGATLTDTDTNDRMRTNNDDNPASYTATRTSTDFLGIRNNTMWTTWLILAILTVAIVGLVWYYGMQNTNNSRSRNE